MLTDFATTVTAIKADVTTIGAGLVGIALVAIGIRFVLARLGGK